MLLCLHKKSEISHFKLNHLAIDKKDRKNILFGDYLRNS